MVLETADGALLGALDMIGESVEIVFATGCFGTLPDSLGRYEGTWEGTSDGISDGMSVDKGVFQGKGKPAIVLSLVELLVAAADGSWEGETVGDEVVEIGIAGFHGACSCLSCPWTFAIYPRRSAAV